MSRTTYVIRDGKLVEKNSLEDSGSVPGIPGFIPDIQSFISPIDGTLISSRNQYRDHCKRHDVVPTSELAGLPASRSTPAPTKRDQEQLKRQIADLVYRR